MNEDTASPISQLPPYLQQLVTEDNRKFMKEIEDWDREQMKKIAASAAAAASAVGDQDINPVSKSKNSEPSSLVLHQIVALCVDLG